MDPSLRKFFDRLHQILGIDTQDTLDKMVARLEQVIAAKAVECVVKGMNPDEAKRYKEFQRRNPTPAQSAEFLEKLVLRSKVEACFSDAVQKVIQQYVAVLLQSASGEQKDAVRKEFEELARTMQRDPAFAAAFEQLQREKQLSTEIS